MTVDAHHHLWQVGRTQHDWQQPETQLLHRDYLPDDLEPQLAAAGVEATVVVQSANRLEDTYGLLELAATTPWVAGVVGWVPLDRPADAAAALDDLADRRALKGVRHLTNMEADPDWVVRAEVIEGLAVVADHGLAFDAVPIDPHQLEHVCTLAERLPELRIVLDHLGKPPLLESGWEPWASSIARIASYPNVAAKVSAGLDIVAGWERWELAAFSPYLEHALETFGPERLMAASNWPVVLLAGDYVDVWAQTRQGLAHLSAAEQERILSGTATEWYRLAGTARLRR